MPSISRCSTEELCPECGKPISEHEQENAHARSHKDEATLALLAARALTEGSNPLMAGLPRIAGVVVGGVVVRIPDTSDLATG